MITALDIQVGVKDEEGLIAHMVMRQNRAQTKEQIMQSHERAENQTLNRSLDNKTSDPDSTTSPKGVREQQRLSEAVHWSGYAIEWPSWATKKAVRAGV